MGVLVTQDPTNCTHLASPGILRTKKFVCALAHAPIVISTDFVDDCLSKDERLDPDNYLLDDPAGEQRLGFVLSEAMSRAKNHRGRLLQKMTIYCTEPVKGGFDTYKAIIEANGGTCLLYKGRSSSATVTKLNDVNNNPEGMTDEEIEHIYLISGPSPAEIPLWSKFRSMVQAAGKDPRVVETDWLLNSALRQQLHWHDGYLLTEEHVNNAS